MDAEIIVLRSELSNALSQLKRLSKVKNAEAVISFKDDELTIEFGGVMVGVRGEGNWRGKARIPGEYLTKVLARALPPGDPICLQFAQGRFSIGGSSVEGTWQDIGGKPIEIPINSSLSYLLSLRENYTDSEIENSGLRAVIADAEERRERLVVRAADVFKPLEIKAEEIRSFIQDCVGRRHKRRSP